tara:strand:- start:282 stop:572 length:291 start_codon:yes stop_codon:yes gene_type:complete
MKITKEQLKQIIKEEIEALIGENYEVAKYEEGSELQAAYENYLAMSGDLDAVELFLRAYSKRYPKDSKDEPRPDSIERREFERAADEVTQMYQDRM